MPQLSIVRDNRSSDVLCRRCEVLLWGSELRMRPLLRKRDSGWDHVSVCICARCGALLPLEASENSLVETISQLARFGLTAGGRPILSSEAEA